MSELKVNKVTPRSGTTVTLGDSGDSVAIPTGVGFNGYGYRNIIINGDMSIAQRGTTATGLGNGDGGYYTVDRWRFVELGSPTFEFTMSQDTDVPTGQGFAKSLKLDCTTAQASLGAGDHLFIVQKVEGQNLQYLKKGTANAESLTLSFWVKSNKTGTYTVYPYDNDNDRLISAAYTINSANTWEKKTITYAGDTTDVLDNDNNSSLEIYFNLALGTDRTSGTLATSWEDTVAANLGVGQVNLADDTANEWYITGVQLEAGTTASDFEFLPVDVNLARCYRYLQKIDASSGNTFICTSQATGSNSAIAVVHIFNELRALPTFSTTGSFAVFTATSSSNAEGTIALFSSTKTQIGISFTRTAVSTLTAGDAGILYSPPGSSSILLSAEL